VAQKKSAADGGSRTRREEANTGEELFAVLCEDALGRYLETLTECIAASCARASRASMAVNITVPPRRRLTIIPAVAGRMLATPWAKGRISVTVDLSITEKTKQPVCQVRGHQKIKDLEICAS
jgi:hypothetical protein